MAAEQSRFFDSVSGDKKYSADQFAEFFRVLVTSGILNGGPNLQVTPTGGTMSVTVNYGVANILGYMYWLVDDETGPYQANIAASASQPRIDRVVLRLDKSLAERKIYIAVKTGTPGASPAPPELEREGNIYELSLARINVRANATSILETDIIDERYSATTCGLMNSLISLDGSTFQAQAEAILEQLATQGYIPETDAVYTPQAGKLLKMNPDGKLPGSITGDAATVGGKTPVQINQLLAPDITEIRLTRDNPTPTQEAVLWIKY